MANINLIIVATNLAPRRERTYPRTWLLHTPAREIVKFHASHEIGKKPSVSNKGAA